LQILLKPFGVEKGPLLPLFRPLVEIINAFDVSMLCAADDA